MTAIKTVRRLHVLFNRRHTLSLHQGQKYNTARKIIIKALKMNSLIVVNEVNSLNTII